MPTISTHLLKCYRHILVWRRLWRFCRPAAQAQGERNGTGKDCCEAATCPRGMQPVAKRVGPAIWCVACHAEDKHKPDRIVQRHHFVLCRKIVLVHERFSFSFFSFFLILFFLFFKEPRFQGSFIRYCTKSATFPHTLYGAPVNAWRCRPRLAGAQGAQYANTLALSCHTRGVLRGHHDTMPCPTSLPSGARRCWAPLLAWPSGRTCGSSCALTSGASGVVHVQALGIPQAPSRTADPCRLRLARVACTFALFLPPLPRRTRADTREHVCIDRTSQH